MVNISVRTGDTMGRFTAFFFKLLSGLTTANRVFSFGHGPSRLRLQTQIHGGNGRKKNPSWAPDGELLWQFLLRFVFFHENWSPIVSYIHWTYLNAMNVKHTCLFHWGDLILVVIDTPFCWNCIFPLSYTKVFVFIWMQYVYLYISKL